MTPSHARKDGRKYRYYIASPLVQNSTEELGSVTRAPAVDIESAVLNAVRGHLKLPTTVSASELIAQHFSRVALSAREIEIVLQSPTTADDEMSAGIRSTRQILGNRLSAGKPRRSGLKPAVHEPCILRVAWCKIPTKRYRAMMEPNVSGADTRPIRAETRSRLLEAIARGRRWLSELQSGSLSAEAIARRECCSKRHVNMTVSLAFLSPELVQAVADRILPRGVGVARLIDTPADWSRQLEMLGLSPSPQTLA